MNSIYDECKADIIKYIKEEINVNYDPKNKLFWKNIEFKLNTSIPVANSSECIHWINLKKYFKDKLIPCLHHSIFQLSEEQCQRIRYPYLLHYFNIHPEFYFGNKTTKYLSNKLIDIHKAIINYTLNKEFNVEIWLNMSKVNPERKFKLFKININDKQHFNLNNHHLRKLQKFIRQKDLQTICGKTNNEWLQKHDVQVNVISSPSDLIMPRIIQQNKKCKSIKSINVESVKNVQECVSSSVESIRTVTINHDNIIPCLKCKTKLALGENVLSTEELYNGYKAFAQANDFQFKLKFNVFKELEKIFLNLQDLNYNQQKTLENVNEYEIDTGSTMKKNTCEVILDDDNLVEDTITTINKTTNKNNLSSEMIDNYVNLSQQSLNHESLVVVCHPEPSQPNPRLFNSYIDEDMSK